MNERNDISASGLVSSHGDSPLEPILFQARSIA